MPSCQAQPQGRQAGRDMHCQSGSQEALPQCIPGGAATVDPRRRCQSGYQEAQACDRGQAQAAHLDGQGPRAGMVQRVGVCVLQLVGVVGAPVLPLLGLLGGLLRWGHSLLWRCQEADSRQQDVAVRYVVAVGRQAGNMKWKLAEHHQTLAGASGTLRGSCFCLGHQDCRAVRQVRHGSGKSPTGKWAVSCR